jgi:hypothetical protein
MSTNRLKNISLLSKFMDKYPLSDTSSIYYLLGQVATFLNGKPSNIQGLHKDDIELFVNPKNVNLIGVVEEEYPAMVINNEPISHIGRKGKDYFLSVLRANV